MHFLINSLSLLYLAPSCPKWTTEASRCWCRRSEASTTSQSPKTSRCRCRGSTEPSTATRLSERHKSTTASARTKGWRSAAHRGGLAKPTGRRSCRWGGRRTAKERTSTEGTLLTKATWARRGTESAGRRGWGCSADIEHGRIDIVLLGQIAEELVLLTRIFRQELINRGQLRRILLLVKGREHVAGGLAVV